VSITRCVLSHIFEKLSRRNLAEDRFFFCSRAFWLSRIRHIVRIVNCPCKRNPNWKPSVVKGNSIGRATRFRNWTPACALAALTSYDNRSISGSCENKHCLCIPCLHAKSNISSARISTMFIRRSLVKPLTHFVFECFDNDDFNNIARMESCANSDSSCPARIVIFLSSFTCF